MDIRHSLYVCLKDHRKHQRVVVKHTSDNENNKKYGIRRSCRINRHPETRVVHRGGYWPSIKNQAGKMSDQRVAFQDSRNANSMHRYKEMLLTLEERKPRSLKIRKLIEIVSEQPLSKGSKNQNQD